MESKSTIKEYFYEAVRMSIHTESELKRQLTDGYHPRVEMFLTNLEKQIKGARTSLLLRKNKILKEETIKGFVYDLTAVFLTGIEADARLRYESDLERVARDAKLQEQKDMDATLAGKPSGIFEEAGVIVDETRDEIFQEKN